jgi:hypothetical protein
MKKTFVLFALFIIGVINCNAQLIHTGDFVKITLPDGVHKLSKKQVDAIVPRFKLPGRQSQSQGAPYVYKMDEVKLGLYNVNVNPAYGDLTKERLYKDEGYLFLRHYGNNSYNSVIKTFGNNQALIINYNIDNIGHYWFFYRNDKKTLGQAGEMEYNMADQAKAESLLNEVLNNIQFTK